MDQTLEQAKAKALESLQLPADTPDDVLTGAADKLTAAKEALTGYLKAAGYDNSAEEVKREALEMDPEVKAALKRFDERMVEIDESRAKAAEIEAERAKFAPNGIADITGRNAENDWEREVQSRADAVYLMKMANSAMQVRGKSFTPLRETRAWAAYERILGNGPGKAMYSTYSSYGDEWVPDDMSPRLTEYIRLPNNASNQFSVIDMPTNPYYLPYLSGDLTAYVTAESTGAHGSGTAPTASDATTAKRTLTAVKLGVKVTFTEELNEDSIIPVLPTLEGNLAYALEEGREQATINGDSGGTHQDNDVGASTTDRRVAWDGLRKYALANSGSKVSLGTFSTSNVRSMRAAMGKYGVNPDQLVWIVGPKGYQNLRDLDEVTTVEKFGDSATIRNGRLEQFDGIPLILSGAVRQDVGSAGVNAASGNTYSFMLCAHKQAFVFGRRRGVTIRFVSGVEDVDQIVMVATIRECFQQVHTADTTNGHYPVTIGYAFSS